MTPLATVNPAPLSRRTLIKTTGGLGLGITLAQVGLLRSVAQESESIQDIVNIAATAEQLAVTLIGGAIDSANQGGYNQEIPAAVVAILTSARAAEQYHLDYLLAAGAAPLTDTFTVPDLALLTDYNTLFTTVVQLETAFIAAYAAAARAFAVANQPELVKIAIQTAGVEGEHRVLANYALGTRPANNVAFASSLFGTVGEAAQALTDLGFIGGDGTEVVYPGPGEIDTSLTSEAEPSGPSVTCGPEGVGGASTSGDSDGAGGATTAPATGVGTAFRQGGGHDGLQQMLGFLGLFGVGAAALAGLSRRLAVRPAPRVDRIDPHA